jgi:kinesin family protein 11
MAHVEESKEKGQNIKVVLRCRPMTGTEAAKEKPAIKCVSDKHVEVNYAAMGKASKKSFAFDGVYGEKSSQQEVYESLVRPVVDEVLQGYNCTVFAYGQTGTGKTHTMEGDVSPSPAGVMKPGAGIIPRAVTQVFKYLEENEFEYTVRISVVELYNEELSDLIASADDGSSQGTLRKLRLMEDAKKGMVLHGVEERAAKDARDIFSILESTNKQRRTAETLCNKQSSRSHQICTLKIFMKEKMLDEEEIIKTGTLNLVDLAGSECVGRSGAMGDRKKEAGQINQSLLTLGRVITALVEHQPHVPYRESKLTRLLQESLGGKTKTCIIATVSPSSANIEETLGTLDYACRAKNIKNTPEINQVQTKKTMMRDMSKYIADLQEQLKAQRDGAGVYLPQTKYDDMQVASPLVSDLRFRQPKSVYAYAYASFFCICCLVGPPLTSRARTKPLLPGNCVQDELKRLSEIELSLQNEIDEKLKQVGRLGCGLKRRRVVWVCV